MVIDFTKKDLYKDEESKLNKFKTKILVKESERDTADVDTTLFETSDGFDRIETSTIVDSPFDIGGGDLFGGDDGGFDDSPFGDFGFGGFGGEEKVREGITEKGNLSNNETYKVVRNPILSFLLSPFFMVFYTVLHIERNNTKLRDWANELEEIKKINIVVIFVAIIFFLIGGRTIVSPLFQIIVGVIMVVGSTIILNKIKGTTEDKTDSGDLFGSFDDSNTSDDFGDDILGGSSYSHSGDVSIFDEDDVDTFGELNDDDEEEYIESNVVSESGVLPRSPVEVYDDSSFYEGLSDVFKRNSKYTGQGYKAISRGDIMNSMSGYLVSNFDNFGAWKEVNERSTVYMNISFTLFLALEKMNNKFGRGSRNEDGVIEYGKMYVRDVKENTMMYKVFVELPEYFKLRDINRNREELTNVLKSSEDDTDTGFLVSTYRQGFVFKLYKPVRQLISLGDIIRYRDEDRGVSTLDEYLDDGIGLPVLLGIKNNEYPVVVDYEDNTSGVIVGGSGSGKSWATFLILENFVIANDYHSLNMIIYDKKAAPFWRNYAMLPHVLGYHSDVDKLLDICNEVYAEIGRRKEVLNKMNVESVAGLRKKHYRNKEYEKLRDMPLLLFIVDEITSTMMELQTTNKELYDSIKGVMTQISAEGRSLGVRMVVIGQRSIDTSVPKGVMANASFKLGMKMDTQSDYNAMGMEDDIKNFGIPSGAGAGIVKGNNLETAFVKTLGVGGVNDEQVLALLRVLSLEWTRRSLGDTFDKDAYRMFKTSYNRDEFRKEALKHLANGEIIPNVKDERLRTDISLEFGGKKPEENTAIVKTDTEVVIKEDIEINNEDSNNFNDFDDYNDYSDYNNINEYETMENVLEAEEEEDTGYIEIEDVIKDKNTDDLVEEDYIDYGINSEDYIAEDDDLDLDLELEEDIELEDETEDYPETYSEDDYIIEEDGLEKGIETFVVVEEEEDEDVLNLDVFKVEVLEEDFMTVYDDVVIEDFIDKLDREDKDGGITDFVVEEVQEYEYQEKQQEELQGEVKGIKNETNIENKDTNWFDDVVDEEVELIVEEDVLKPKPKPISKPQPMSKPKTIPTPKPISKPQPKTETKATPTQNHKPISKKEEGVRFKPRTEVRSKVKRATTSRSSEGDIRSYILKVGIREGGLVKIRKEDLRKVFNGKEIGVALKSSVIVSLDETYFSVLE